MSGNGEGAFVLREGDLEVCLDARLLAELALDATTQFTDRVYQILTESPDFRVPDEIRAAVLGEAYQRLLIGAYHQTHEGSGEAAFSMPFQMRQAVGEGFQGDITEVGPRATFAGEFEPGVSVAFDKQYAGRPHTITYGAEFDPSVGLYLGGWRINTEERGDLEPQGKFFLKEL